MAVEEAISSLNTLAARQIYTLARQRVYQYQASTPSAETETLAPDACTMLQFLMGEHELSQTHDSRAREYRFLSTRSWYTRLA